MVRFYVIGVILFIILWAGSTGQNTIIIGSGQDELSSFETCSHENKTWIVNDTESATSLAEAVNCTGGSFNATWRGRVLVERTIIIPEGTSLNVTGEGSGAEINGGGKTRLFIAVGASLHINGLTLQNSNATHGGAIYVDSSHVTLDGETSFIENTASYDGGALYIRGISNVSWNGETSFVNNLANGDGGAMNIQSGSTASWVGKAFFVNNTAGYLGGALHVLNSIASWDGVTTFNENTAEYGGGLYVRNSNVFWDGETSFVHNTAVEHGGALRAYQDTNISWDGETSFVNNMANGDGGAMNIQSGSTASWYGETSFVNNTAVEYGGALRAYQGTNISWDGETSFVNNMANGTGGAIDIQFGSTASWGGKTFFVNNTAGYLGGALHVLNSIASWEGVALFNENTAEYGGGLYVRTSNISWDGETSFVNNTAVEYGGALRAYQDTNISWYGATSFVDNLANDDGGALNIQSGSTASWGGKTVFVNNTAGYLGGALHVLDSIALWDGVTSFNENTAENGGGLYVRNSDVFWDGETSFVNNTVVECGGALGVYKDSDISWNGETTFVNNMASSDGGAMDIQSGSTASWGGKTFFANNTAGYLGGALHVLDSIALWDGVTSFNENIAEYGGGLYVRDSDVSWDGETSFVHNTAAEYGGALRGYQNSDISWHGVTSFFDNWAQYGGALAVYDNSVVVTWTGVTSFTGNEAISDGGAIYATIGCDINVDGDTNFTNNVAAVDGGAVCLSLDCDDENTSYFVFEDNPTVLFQGNTCGGNGGALAFIGEVYTSFSINMTFKGNTAGVAGGAIYLSGVKIGIRFEGTRYISNSAVIGGGLYSTGSGTTVIEDGNKTSDQKTTALIGCTFLGNKATRTGGAMDSGEGIDTIVNTSFVENTAIIGGALSLVGTSSLIGCTFVENSAYEDEGPAISNDGDITNFSGCNFVDNVFNCEAGNYLVFDDTDTQLDDSCTGCSINCTNCKFEGKRPTECVEALEHSSATGVDATLQSLLIDPGYWRATNSSTNILACYNSEACLGGVTGKDDYCLQGYEGPYCSVCSKNYTSSFGFSCNKCDDNAAGGITLAVILAALVVLIVAALVSYTISGSMGSADEGIVGRITRLIPLHSVKTVIVVWQIITEFATVTNVVFPGVYQTFLDGVDILNFDLTWVLSIGCIIDTDFHDQLLLATMGPLMCVIILGGTYIAAMRRNRASEDACGNARRKHVSMVLLLTFLIYSSVSSTLFKTFACDKLDDGKNYLRADYRVECDSSKHNLLEIYAAFMVILYVVGIPALYGVLLYTNREAITKNTGREEDESIKPITDLWKPYRPERYFYEVVECVRRVLLTGALVCIYPNTAGQIAVALMLATFFMITSEALAPYSSPWDTWISRTGHAIVCTSMFLALLLKVDVTGEHASSQVVFESVLVATHSCLVLVVVVQAVAMVMALKTEVKEHHEPQMSREFSRGIGKGGVFLDDEASESEEKSHPNQVMGQSQTAASKDVDISWRGGERKY